MRTILQELMFQLVAIQLPILQRKVGLAVIAMLVLLSGQVSAGKRVENCEIGHSPILTFSLPLATVGSGGNYPTLKSAFDAINSGVISGDVTLQIISSTVETATASLNASGTGFSNYSSVLIYATGTGYSISGNLSTPIININGGDNVVIDGRVNSIGSTPNLTISNAHIGTAASAIQFINSAENNSVRYATISSSTLSGSAATVYFSSSASGNGNDGNIIEYCNLTNTGGNRPVNSILSFGTAGRENSGNIIRSNSIYNFFYPGSNSNGINISGNSIDWIVSENSLYESGSMVPLGNYGYNAIRIGTANTHLVTNNYIGGSTALCGGSPWNMLSSFATNFVGIVVTGTSAAPTLIHNNSVRNFNYSSTSANPWDGIYLTAGNSDISGNIIGAATGINSIVSTSPNASATATISGGVITSINLVGGGSGFTSAPLVTFTVSGSTTPAVATAIISAGSVTGFTILNGGSGYTSIPTVNINGTNYSTTHGIRCINSGVVNLQNNSIGSITTNSSTAYSHCFEGIVVSGVTNSVVTIVDNLIGSLSAANSIKTASAAASSIIKQDLRGIFINSAINSATISRNTVANMTNAFTGASVSKVDGICSSSITNVIQNNIIRDMTSCAGSITVRGIQQSVSTAGGNQLISGNTVYNLSNTHPTATISVIGIDFFGPTSGINAVTGNFVHSLTVASTSNNCELDGLLIGNGITTIANNIINLGIGQNTGCRIYGISENSTANTSNNNSIYFNSIHLAGGVSSAVTSSTAALWSSNNTAIRNFRNNILMNVRSGGTTGKHYAVRVAGTSGLTIDYNDYYTNGGGFLGSFNNSDKNTLTLWKAATSQDVNSLNTNPLFTLAGVNPLNYYTSAILPAATGTGIMADFTSLARSTAPKMGALEITSYVWSGATSTNFGTASNWQNGLVPANGSDISFAASPFNNCILDQNRSLRNITNAQGTYKLLLNGYTLNLLGNLIFSNNAKIDATAESSVLEFGGILGQNLPIDALVNNNLNGCTLNNESGLTINNDIAIAHSLTLTNGAFKIGNNTLTVNGDLTIASGTMLGGISSNVIIGGSGAAIFPSVSLNNLTVNRSSGITLAGAVSISGTLSLTSGTVYVGANTLTISGNSPIRVSGNIDVSDAASNINFLNPTAISLPDGIFLNAVNNLTIDSLGGVTSLGDFTLNGQLSLSSPNPTSTKGSLDMRNGVTITTLSMGPISQTVGVGDTTGIIKRTSITADVNYSFGNEFMNAYFTNTGTLPSEISLKVSIGTEPLWKVGAIKRNVEIIQTGAVGTSGVVSFHYLDSELNGNDEADMVLWVKAGNIEYGRSASNSNENWVSLSNVNMTFFSGTFDGAKDIVLDDFSSTNTLTWNGSLSTSWTSVENWTPNVGPSATKNIIIPSATTTTFSPTIPSATEIKSLTIEGGGILNSAALAQLTINGSSAWNNYGIFNPNTSTVLFTNTSATISGITNFYNLTINSTKALSLTDGCIVRIAGALLNNGTLTAKGLGTTTVEYNGSAQTIMNPNGTNAGYDNLKLSGSGIKTMSAALQFISGNLTLTDAVTTTAAASLTIGGNLVISENSTFKTGSFNHNIAGNFDNNGTFTASSPYSIVLDGSTLQSVLGSANTTFNKLILDNSSGTDLFSNINISNELALANGNFQLGQSTLRIIGNMTKTFGFIDAGLLPTLAFNGTSAIVLAPDLFLAPPILNNLSLNRSGGLTIGQDIAVMGTLSLLTGRLSIAENNLTLGSAATITVSSPDSSKMIVADGSGELRKVLGEGIAFTYPIGDMTGTAEYSPITITLQNDNLSNNYFGVNVQNAKHPANASASQYINRFWNVTQSGAAANVKISAKYTPADIIGNESGISAAMLTGNFNQANNPWMKYGPLSANTVSIDNVALANGQSTAVSGIALANPTVSIAAIAPVCSGSNILLSTTVIADPTVSYQWSPTEFLNNPTIANPTVTGITAPTTYTVTIKDGNGISAVASTTVGLGNTTTWTGSWDNGLPTSSSAAVISANYNEGIAINCCSLTINNNAVVVIPPDVNVTLFGALTVSSGSFTLSNNSNLIQTSNAANSGSITILRDSAPIVRLDHTLWSSPVSGSQTLQQFSPNTLSNRFYKYNTTSNGYSATAASGTFPLATTIGIRAPNNWGTTEAIWQGSFTGVPNNGEITVAIDDSGYKYNGIGNPYPSVLSGAAFVAANSSNITGTLYFYAHTLSMNAQSVFPAGTNYALWNPGTGGTPATTGGGGTGIAPITPTGNIQIGQGFLVQATNPGDIAFNNSMRLGSFSSQFFRNNSFAATEIDTIERHRIWLNFSAESDPLNVILVGYASGATYEADYGYDGPSFGATGSELYSLINENEYSIQGRPLPFEPTDYVPLGFKAMTPGNFSISIYDVDGLFSDNQQVFIKDNLLNTITSINTAPYIFSSEDGIFNDRLEIVYTDGSLGVGNNLSRKPIVIYAKLETIYVKSEIDDISIVRIFDLRGRIIYEEKGLHQQYFQTTQSGLAQQVLLVQVTDVSGQVVTKKVIL